jgi:hypothetical protein
VWLQRTAYLHAKLPALAPKWAVLQICAEVPYLRAGISTSKTYCMYFHKQAEKWWLSYSKPEFDLAIVAKSKQ